MKRPLFAGLLAAGALTACAGPHIVGGPCTYETSIITGKITEVDDYGATLSNNDGDFYVSLDYLGEAPAIGETLTLKREKIIEGTCTPEIYTPVSPED